MPIELQPIELHDCPVRETLAGILAGTWPVDSWISDHIDQCRSCQQTLNELSDNDSLREYQQHARNLADSAHGLEAPLDEGDAGSIGGLAIKSVLGRGGMGIVYRAIDPSLGRTVAVKVMSRGGNFDSIQRFERESRASAKLRHDNVVPVYQAGRTADGRPFIVMPLVEGESLKARLLRGQPDFQESARIISGVARGLAAAHQAGLIHRDVKPANILLDQKDDRPRLADFGLVRTPTDQALTQRNVVCGTPDYMSPEQIDNPTSTDCRGDIYSLGVTLYECLTGNTPYRGKPMELLDQHRYSDPIPPRQLNHLIPLDLQNICLRAMAREPAYRYQSATELAEDLERFLKGEPVLARETSRWRKLILWSRRNPAVAFWSGVSAGLLVLGMITTSVLWLQSAASARQSQQLANDLSVKQHELQAALTSTEAQRKRAEERFGELRSLANKLLFEIYPEIEFLEQSLDARKKIVSSALEYLDSLYQESKDDPELQAELATAYEKVGELQGVLGNAHLGDKQAGLESYRKAQRLRQAIYDLDPTQPESAEKLANNFYVIARTVWLRDEIAAAKTAYETSLLLQRAATVLDPENSSAQNKLAVILIDYASVPQWEGELEQAMALANDAKAILKTLTQNDPTNPEYKKTLARLLRSMSRIYADLENVPESEKALLEALQIGRELVATDPDNFAVARSVWLTRYLLAELYIVNQVLEKVIPACEQTIDFPKRAFEKEPKNAMIANDLANAYFNLARSYRLNKRFEESIEQSTKALRVMQSLANSYPEDTEYQRNQAIYLTDIARSHLQLMEYQEVIEPANQAIDILNSMGSEGSSINKYDLLIVAKAAAEAHHHLGQQTQALERIDQAIEMGHELEETNVSLIDDELRQQLKDAKLIYQKAHK